MLTPEDAERIALAQNLGVDHARAAKSARRRADRDRGVRVASLMGAPDAPPVVKEQNGVRRVVAQKPKPEPVLPEASPAYSVETFKAARSAKKRLPSLVTRVPSPSLEEGAK